MLSAIKRYRMVLLGTLVVIVAGVLICCLLSPWAVGPDQDKEMPAAMKELSQNESVEWMAGMWVKLTGGGLPQGEAASGVEVYSRTEEVLQATVTLQNGLNRTQPYALMVFADGAPMAFSIGGNTYQSYPVSLTAEPVDLEIALQPEFTLQLGRLDFLLLFDGNPNSEFYLTTYTLWIEQAEAERAPSKLQGTTAQREGIRDSYTNGAYGAWLWNWDARPGPTDQIGPREITIGQGKPVLLEAVAAAPGLYRTVLVMDGQPISFAVDGELHTWLDWRSDGTDMLQVPLWLPEDFTGGGSFFTVTTPLEAEQISQPNMASVKIQTMSFQMGEE